MITVSQLIYGAEMPPTGHPCALCGQPFASELFKVSDTFTNWDRLRSPASELACPACAACLAMPSLRRGSWVAHDGRAEMLPRERLHEVLFQPPEPPFAIYITSSFKKHGFFKARVNLGRGHFYVQFEEVGIEFEPARWTAIWEVLWDFYNHGFSKRELLHGGYAQRKVRAFGCQDWWAFEELLRPRRHEPAFALLVHALYREEEDADDGGRQPAVMP